MPIYINSFYLALLSITETIQCFHLNRLAIREFLQINDELTIKDMKALPIRNDIKEDQELMKLLYPPNFKTIDNGFDEDNSSLKRENNHRMNIEGKKDTSISSFNNNDDSLNIALQELDSIIGLESVKEFISDLKDFVEIQQIRSKSGHQTNNHSLHIIFTGNPGTGKTTVARILANIFKSLGVISKGHLVEVSREDLVDGHVGQTAAKTQKVVEKALGGVLFIDEAYTLSRGGEQDFGKEAIDTLVKNMEDYREDLIVILAGYTKEMDSFLDVNSGLKSRFPYQIEFPDYTSQELLEIIKKMINESGFNTSTETEKNLLELIDQKQVRGLSDSGNGRLVRNMLQEAIRKQAKRLKKNGLFDKKSLLELTSADFGYTIKSDFDLDKEFSSFIGNEELKKHVGMLAAQLKINRIRAEKGITKLRNKSYHMIFKGNPGTGKTTIARIIANMLKDMGLIKKGQLIEVDRSDLVGEYVGHTAIKTKKVIQKALGGVLFIDEAYALSSGGPNDFGHEAINTLIKEMEDHREDLIVILAGYNNEMNAFLNSNSGLESRFPFQFNFHNYSSEELLKILFEIAEQEGFQIECNVKNILLPYFKKELSAPNFGNGRFVRNLYERAVQIQAYRLSKKDYIDITDLQQLKESDFVGALIEM